MTEIRDISSPTEHSFILYWGDIGLSWGMSRSTPAPHKGKGEKKVNSNDRWHCNRHSGFPHVIHSSKRFQGLTGLEEYVGGGFDMALRIEVDGRALLLKFAHYFLMLGSSRLRLPRSFSPGDLTVTHHAVDTDTFEFILHVEHAVFETQLHQRAIFKDST